MTFRDDHDAAPRVVDRTPRAAQAIEPPERAPRQFDPLAILVALVILAGLLVSAWLIVKGNVH